MKTDTAKIKRFILPNLPYVFLFWLFDKFSEAYRTAQGADALKKFIGAVAGLNVTLSHPLPALDPFDLCVGLVGAAAVYGVVLYKKKHAKKWRKDVVCCKGRKWIAPNIAAVTTLAAQAERATGFTCGERKEAAQTTNVKINGFRKQCCTNLFCL
jgi:type IV secretion system protein VirD4